MNGTSDTEGRTRTGMIDKEDLDVLVATTLHELRIGSIDRSSARNLISSFLRMWVEEHIPEMMHWGC